MKPSDDIRIVLTILLFMFIGFKMTGIIDWSWWWVLSPLWIPAAIFVVIIISALIIARGDK